MFKTKQIRHQSVNAPSQSVTYGRALRAQTPVDTVLTNCYGQAADEMTRMHYEHIKS